MEISYLIGQTGHYMKRRNPLFEAVFPVASNPEAPEVEESLTFVGKKIPGDVFRQWQTFTSEVSKRNKGHESEAALLLFYNPQDNTWDAFPPKQKLTVASVDYSGVSDAEKQFREKNGKHWLMAGTLHSHPGMSSEPSPTDKKDEKDIEGVHIIVPDFGRKGENGITIHATAHHIRFLFEKVAHLIDFKVEGEKEVPEEWFKQITFGGGHESKVYTVGGYGGYGEGWYRGGSGRNLVYAKAVEKLKDLRDAKLVLKKLGTPKRMAAKMVEDYPIFTEACELLDKANDLWRDMRTTQPPVNDHELRRFTTASEDVVEKCLDLIQAMSIWLEPDEKGGKDVEEKEEEKTHTVESEKGGTEEVEGKSIDSSADMGQGFCG